MSKFNSNSTGIKTENLACGNAYEECPKLKLVSILLTSFVQNQFYRSANKTLIDLSNIIDNIPDKKFVAKAGIFARTEYGMRSISHVLASEIVTRVKGEAWVKRFIERVVYRPDDTTEILSYYLNKYGKPIPNSLKKGFALAFDKFDEYQIAKYQGKGKKVKLVDVVNLCHPKSNKILNKLIAGNLKQKNTWENNLSEAEKSNNKEQAKKEARTDIVRKKKLGIIANVLINKIEEIEI